MVPAAYVSKQAFSRPYIKKLRNDLHFIQENVNRYTDKSFRHMKTVHDYISSDFLNWLHDNNFKHRQVEIKTDKGALENLYNDKFCIKIYDRLGHGFGVIINVAEKYDESIYDNDSFSLHWAFKYFKIKQTASFKSRTENQYEQNLPNLFSDIKIIITRLNQMNISEWNSMKEWINKEAGKQFK